MINYEILRESQNYYKELGFENLETPWYVSNEYINFTFKNQDVKNDFKVYINFDELFLVGSREQSFISMDVKNELKKGKFQSITPCFRNEIEDNLHNSYFMKNEIYINTNITINTLKNLIDTSFKFFSKYLDTNDLKIIETFDSLSEISYDIYYKDIELGSYGIRNIRGLKWIYGTGCAEPRLSYCINLSKNK